MQKNAKNGTFFYKERNILLKRTERSFKKNGCPTLETARQSAKKREYPPLLNARRSTVWCFASFFANSREKAFCLPALTVWDHAQINVSQ